MTILAIHNFSDFDPDPMLDIEAAEQEQQAAFDFHNGYLCTVELS
jgi:hypothetical protein